MIPLGKGDSFARSVLLPVLLLLLLLSGAPIASAQGELIFGEDNGDYGAAERVAPGVSVALGGGRDTVTDFGSTDESLGTVPVAGVPAGGGARRFRLENSKNVFTVTVVNDARQAIDLDSLEFDYSRAFAASPRVMTVFYDGGDLGSAMQLVSFTDDTPGDASTRISDYDDYSVDLGALLGDHTLAQGEEATFRIVFSDSSSPATSGVLDNVGVFGTLGSLVVDAAVNADNPRWEISPYVTGLHQVYSNVPDAVYADGSIAAWTRRVGIKTSRFPGGTVVKYWDWENPSGLLAGDSWHPDWDPANNRPPEDWMSLDEYLEFVRQSGITPMFGVNSLAGVTHNRTPEGIARAGRMVQYVVDRGYGGALWYIGNEEVGEHGGIEGYAQIFAQYATAMKAVDPDILIFWNDNGATAGRIASFLAHDGGTSDGLETHGKWPYGGDPAGYAPGTYEEWLNEVPLRDRKNSNRAWRFAANTYRNAAAAAGRPDYLIANNEWGLGKNDHVLGFTRYTKGLLLTEFLMELTIGNWFSACLWDMENGSERGVLDQLDGHRFNPVAIGMNMLADAQDGRYVNVNTNADAVHGFASMKGGALILYLLNKAESPADVAITLHGAGYPEGRGRLMVDSPDGYGQLTALSVAGSGSTFNVTLPALSFGEISFADAGTVLEAHSPQCSVDQVLLGWRVLPGWPVQLDTSTDLLDWQVEETGIFPDFTRLERWRSIADARRFWSLELLPSE